MQNQVMRKPWTAAHPALWMIIRVLLSIAAVAALILFSLLLLYFSRTSAGAAAVSFTGWLLAGNPPNATWYITRSAGLVAFLLLWISTLWGLGVSTRILGRNLHGSFTYDFHQVISLLALGFTAIHIFILLFDTFTPFNLAQIAVPFLSDYRPGWVGLGIISLYILILVTVTFYLRGRIGSRAFRAIHTLSLAGFFGAVFHGLFSGTDSGFTAVKILYFAAAFSTVFLSAYWIAAAVLQRRSHQNPHRSSPAPSRQAAD